MTEDNWEQKYTDLLEKHNDQIDDLLSGSFKNLPALLVQLKVSGSCTDDLMAMIENNFRERLGVDKNNKDVVVVATRQPKDKHGVEIEMFPMRAIAEGKVVK